MAESKQAWVSAYLPSRGIFYKQPDGTDAIPDGNVAVRRMNINEMATLQSPGIDVLQRMDLILSRASKLPNKFPASDLLLTDRMAILLFQRVVSLGKDYTFVWKCGECKRSNKHTVDLSALPETTPEILLARNRATDPEFTLSEPFEVKLPDYGHTVSMRLLYTWQG